MSEERQWTEANERRLRNLEEELNKAEAAQAKLEELEKKRRGLKAKEIEHLTAIAHLTRALLQKCAGIFDRLEEIQAKVPEVKDGLDKMRKTLREWMMPYFEYWIPYLERNGFPLFHSVVKIEPPFSDSKWQTIDRDMDLRQSWQKLKEENNRAKEIIEKLSKAVHRSPETIRNIIYKDINKTLKHFDY